MNTREFYGTFWVSSPLWWWDPTGREIFSLDTKDSCVLQTIAAFLGSKSHKAVSRETLSAGCRFSVKTVDWMCKKLKALPMM